MGTFSGETTPLPFLFLPFVLYGVVRGGGNKIKKKLKERICSLKGKPPPPPLKGHFDPGRSERVSPFVKIAEKTIDDLRFSFLLNNISVFQLYQDDGMVVMKGCVQWNFIYGRSSIQGPVEMKINLYTLHFYLEDVGCTKTNQSKVFLEIAGPFSNSSVDL